MGGSDPGDLPRIRAWPQVNYTFTCGTNSNYMHRSILMAEYGHWMAPHPGGKVKISASTNLAYVRAVLLEKVDQDESIFEAEFLLHRQIQKSGWEIHVASRAAVEHESWTSLKAGCQANGANTRALGSPARAESGSWGTGRRLLWSLAMILTPALHIARLAGTMRRRPALWGSLISSLPVLVAIYGYSACSEAAGYLFGAGHSREGNSCQESWRFIGMVSVSVILSAWNSQDTVVACLDSLRAQTFRDFEVILVDSSPTEETVNPRAGTISRSAARAEHGTVVALHAARDFGRDVGSGRDAGIQRSRLHHVSPLWLERFDLGRRWAPACRRVRREFAQGLVCDRRSLMGVRMVVARRGCWGSA